MAITKATRLSKIARELNVGISTIVDFLQSKGQKIDSNPNSKVTDLQYDMLYSEYSSDQSIKKESERVNLKHLRDQKETISLKDIDQDEDQTGDNDKDEVIEKEHNVSSNIFETETEKNIGKEITVNVVGKMDIEKKVEKPKEKEEVQAATEKVEEIEKPEKKVEKETTEAVTEKETETEKISEEDAVVRVVGKIDLDSINQKTRPAKKSKEEKDKERKEQKNTGKTKKEPVVTSPSEKEPGTIPDAPEISEKVPDEKVIDAKEEAVPDEIVVIRAKAEKLSGPTVLGRMELPKVVKKQPNENRANEKKKKRKRIKKDSDKVNIQSPAQQTGGGGVRKPGDTRPASQVIKKGSAPVRRKKGAKKPEISEEDIQKQIKDTLARLTSKGKSKGSKHRRDKRDAFTQRLQEEELQHEQDKNILKVTEFVTVSELASMMGLQATEVIATCMSLGMFVSINQRLDAETMSLLAEEHGFELLFVSVELQEAINEEIDKPEELVPRPPIVTVMGHVDHGKTKLLDYVRSANVIDGEAGGITQHIGAYGVKLDDGRQITFLDTPGHEAFTAMRARGAQVTDLAIIVIAADDGVKPQTVEAINHAQAAGVPMVFAINKIDVPAANPEKIKEGLANMNILVEDWGGKYQSQEISAKTGLNISDLLDKVLLEAEMLELNANPNKRAVGTVVESSLDKGRGYVATILVQAGTLRIGDIVLAGTTYGKVKAMYNERGAAIKEAGPSQPVLILGLDGAPQAGDKFNVMDGERETREIASKRGQLQREQGIRTQKHITLDEIGRRIAIGNFQELNVIVKGDVDGSVEALADSLLKLSTEEIEVNIKHKAVGQISEADVLLAAASNAIVIGFQVRPSLSARRLAEKEEIDIRLYSIIYDAIDEIKSAMEGMLSPEIRENIVATLEILEVFDITKVGTIAGCLVREGKIKRTSKVRVIREGIVIYTGELGSLKRFKDDAKEAVSGQECGLNIKNFNDIKVGDNVEAYEEFEVKKKL
jgi:translation initiation factor IF-2